MKPNRPHQSQLDHEIGASSKLLAASGEIPMAMDMSRRPHGGGEPWDGGGRLGLRADQRRGQDWIGPELGVPARTVSRILRRHDLPDLAELDPTTGQVVRASKATTIR